MSNTRFSVDYAPRGTANCKKCKQKLEKGTLRLAKVVPNPFSESAGDMKQYYHSKCLFDSFRNARSTTKIVESAEDVENWADLEQEDKDNILKLIKDVEENRGTKKKGGDGSVKKKPAAASESSPTKKHLSPSPTPSKQKTLDEAFGAKKKTTSAADGGSDEDISEKEEESTTKATDESHPDNSLLEFRKLCEIIAGVGSYHKKTETLKNFIENGSSGDEYEGDLYVLIKLLLPGVVKRVYNINSKQLVKHYSQIFGVDHTKILDHFNSGGDVADTIESYFKANKRRQPCDRSSLTLQEVDKWLEEMTKYTKEEDQQRHLEQITKKCTASDLATIIRLLKHDLRINAGAKHILEALDPNAYQAFQASRNLKNVITKLEKRRQQPSLGKSLSISVQLGTPVLPMLAEPCRSVEQAMKKCPHGMFAEIKYDGERVQVHKKGSDFFYYSRSLKPVQPHKVSHFKNFIPKAFPGGGDLILDAEVLLIDNQTSKPLPFGSLGVHKNRHKLQKMINRAIRDGLEGLVLKDTEGVYEPGKRHWLKVKKDYLKEGAMADSADLIVLGAFYGTGNKGGQMSVFLMGCYDPKKDKFCTVTKCGNGHDDATLEKINKQMKSDVEKISKDFNKLPNWLLCSRQLVPDFVVKDPKKAPVWEIAGAEFSSSDAHTADGISIRFPRVTKIRDDKDWKTATNLAELKVLYDKSKEKSDFIGVDDDGDDEEMEKIEEEAKQITKGHSLVKQLQKWDDNEEDDSKAEESSSSKSSSPTKLSPVKQSRDASTTPKKRKVEKSDVEDEEMTPKKKGKVVCKYGAKCYQTNPEHKKDFWHPGDKDQFREKTDVKEQDDVDNEEELFCSIKFYLPESVDKRKELIRYVNYFGGDVVDDEEDATYIVINQGETIESKSGGKKIVTTVWLWDCIKKKQLLPLPDL